MHVLVLFIMMKIILTLGPLDINECTLMTDSCQHECINTVGSYICDCNVGYMLNPNGLYCTGEHKFIVRLI